MAVSVPRGALGLAPIAVGAILALVAFVAVPSRLAGATSVGTLRSEAAQVGARLSSLDTSLGVATERYDQAELRYEQVSQELDAAGSRLAKARAVVASDEATLRTEAIASYTTGGTLGAEELFSVPSLRSSVAKEYLAVSSGNLRASVAALGNAEARLASLEASLSAEKSQAAAALTSAALARQSGMAAQSAAESLLASLKGRIATLVSEEQAAAAAASRARWSAQSNLPPLPPAQGAAIAIRAAESQIGVPYEWGGDTPGVGFDCSGLTMWAWGQAGVSLTHSAAAQYDEVAHVPYSEAQPGDLLFWASGGYVYHVAIYLGNGEMIDAPQPGQTVQIQPVFYNGLIGAGRP